MADDSLLIYFTVGFIFLIFFTYRMPTYSSVSIDKLYTHFKLYIRLTVFYIHIQLSLLTKTVVRAHECYILYVNCNKRRIPRSLK